MLGNSNQQPEHGHLTLERRLNSSFHCTIIWAGMLLSSCTSALGRPFLFPSAGSSHTGLCLLLFSGPGVVLTGSWGCPCLGVRPLGSPDEDSFPSLGPLGLSMPELSGSHPALRAGWPRVTHVREEGVRRQAPKVGVFPPMFCYMAITPAVRQGPVRQGLGGLKGSGQSSPSSYPPLLTRHFFNLCLLVKHSRNMRNSQGR